MVRRLVLVLGDQLTHGLSALRAADPAKDIVVMAEVAAEVGYVAHHKKKIALIFSAMRHFAQELREAGWQVDYTELPAGLTSMPEALLKAAEQHGTDQVLTTQCGEWRLREALEACPLKISVLPDERFIHSSVEFATWAEGRKQLRMEYFYRDMRRKTGILMDGDQPAGGQWNYDKDNRKPGARDLFLPSPERHDPDAITRDVLDMVTAFCPDNPGSLTPFWFATDRAGAEQSAAHFMKEALPDFGAYQDAMLDGERFLYHSILSIYLNIGLLDPLDLCRQAEAEYRAGRAPINSVEGFVRQILGWREFVRAIYDHQGPDYTASNFLEAQRALPAFYWSAETNMACMRAAVSQTLEEAYAHHIQRLMLTGNFALLAGIDPHQVHEWYLAIYADAFEWVEAPNVIGMSQFADGGVVGSKPYAASGAYIDRMSDHCKGCAYSVKQKSGEGACPFNPLYWHFLIRNRERFETNPRMAQMYRTWERMDETRRSEVLTSGDKILRKLDAGDRL